MEELQTAALGLADERVAWEGLASSCAPPIKKLGAFMLVAFAVFTTATTAVVLFYDLFGAPEIEGGGVSVPQGAFYAIMAMSATLGLGGYLFWLWRSLRLYGAFSKVLRRGGLDPRRPTLVGLRAYSDEQLLALRARYEKLGEGRLRGLFERTFGFHADDSFSLGPLSVLPGTFEMGVLRVEWEASLLLSSGESANPGRSPGSRPEIGWRTEGRHGLLPRRADETLKLVYALRYTQASVRLLKRRYGYRADQWHATVPEGKLWDAVRDYEAARRIQAVLYRKSRTR